MCALVTEGKRDPSKACLQNLLFMSRLDRNLGVAERLHYFFTFMHWRRKWQPIPVFLSGESQGPGTTGKPSPTPARSPHPPCAARVRPAPAALQGRCPPSPVALREPRHHARFQERLSDELNSYGEPAFYSKVVPPITAQHLKLALDNIWEGRGCSVPCYTGCIEEQTWLALSANLVNERMAPSGHSGLSAKVSSLENPSMSTLSNVTSPSV